MAKKYKTLTEKWAAEDAAAAAAKAKKAPAKKAPEKKEADPLGLKGAMRRRMKDAEAGNRKITSRKKG